MAEASSLTWGDVDFAREEITTYRHKGQLGFTASPERARTSSCTSGNGNIGRSPQRTIGTGDAAAGNGETILVINDETSILTITKQTLQGFGYTVLTAADGARGVAMYAQHRHEIAVVVTDMMMPVMDGAATIHALLSINPAIQIIAVSGLNANGSVTKI